MPRLDDSQKRHLRDDPRFGGRRIKPPKTLRTAVRRLFGSRPGAFRVPHFRPLGRESSGCLLYPEKIRPEIWRPSPSPWANNVRLAVYGWRYRKRGFLHRPPRSRVWRSMVVGIAKDFFKVLPDPCPAAGRCYGGVRLYLPFFLRFHPHGGIQSLRPCPRGPCAQRSFFSGEID